MDINQNLDHYEIQELSKGVYAALHKEGGLAYSNSGILDLGGKTIVVDTGNSDLSGAELRKVTKDLTGREADQIIMTHIHGDHWNGAQSFSLDSKILTTQKLKKMRPDWTKSYLEVKEDPTQFQRELEELKLEFETEKDSLKKAQLEAAIQRLKGGIDFAMRYEPRYTDETYSKKLIIEGSTRKVKLIDLNIAHSSSDTLVLLEDEKITFIGDIGFFDTQPYMGDCRLPDWKVEIQELIDSNYEIFVPGHGPLGGKKDLQLMLDYFDRLEEKVGEVVEAGGSVKDALMIELEEPYKSWLINAYSRFEVNVNYMYKWLEKNKTESGQ